MLWSLPPCCPEAPRRPLPHRRAHLAEGAWSCLGGEQEANFRPGDSLPTAVAAWQRGWAARREPGARPSRSALGNTFLPLSQLQGWPGGTRVPLHRGWDLEATAFSKSSFPLLALRYFSPPSLSRWLYTPETTDRAPPSWGSWGNMEKRENPQTVLGLWAKSSLPLTTKLSLISFFSTFFLLAHIKNDGRRYLHHIWR